MSLCFSDSAACSAGGGERTLEPGELGAGDADRAVTPELDSAAFFFFFCASWT
jgi:hypothetical protein